VAVKLVPAVRRVAPHDRPLCRLLKGERFALAVVRVYAELPRARELRITVDGHLRWHQLFHGPGLEDAAYEKRRLLEERGWSAVAD
jgi:hypothetical protein